MIANLATQILLVAPSNPSFLVLHQDIKLDSQQKFLLYSPAEITSFESYSCFSMQLLLTHISEPGDWKHLACPIPGSLLLCVDVAFIKV